MRTPFSKIFRTIIYITLWMHVIPATIQSAALENFNLVTCLPQQDDCFRARSHEIPSIQELCQAICDGTAGSINTYVAPGYYYGRNIHIIQGVQAVYDHDVIYIFVSGWAGFPSNAPYRCNGNALYYAYLYQQADIIPGVCVCYDHPNSTLRTATFGQKTDQDNLYQVITLVKEKNPHAELVLVGSSYGATTILNFLTQQPIDKLKCIKAAVLESPFINLESIIMHRWPRYLYSLGTSLVSLLARCLPSYTSYAVTVLDVQKTSRAIPIFIGAMHHDPVVPYTDVVTIVTHMCAINVAPVYFFTSTTVQQHSYLCKDNAYTRAVNRFYCDIGLYEPKPWCKQPILVGE